MSIYKTTWNLTVEVIPEIGDTMTRQELFEEALAKVQADADFRKEAYGETWEVSQDWILNRIHASITQAVNNLDEAG